jgi:MOZ/SAS family
MNAYGIVPTGYLLSKKEQRAGSPEKPLSGLGALGYKNYWTLALMRYLDSAPDKPSLEGQHFFFVLHSTQVSVDISTATSMTIEDIYTTLTQQNMISSSIVTPPPVRPSPGQSIKFPKGRKHGIARRHLQRTQTNDDVDSTPKTPFSPPTQYEIRWDRESVSQYLATWEAKGYLKLKPEKLKWSPFLLARMKKTEGLQTLVTESSAIVEPVTSDITPVITNGLATPQSVARQPSVSIFDDNAVVSGSREPLEADFQRDQGRETELPIFEHASQLPPDEAPDTPRLKRPRSQAKGSTLMANHVNGDSPTHKSFAKGHHTRSDSARASELEQSLAKDQALAAKLALEERRSSRSLRARPERTPDLSRTSASVTRSSSPRKRRRVESSPESESGVLGTAVNGTPSQRSNGSASSPRHQRKTSQLLNGSGAGHDTSHPAAPLSSRMNVVPPSPLPSTAKTLNKADDAVDVKSEAATTPLTALTSRHSIPSDDTVIVTEAINGKQPEDHNNVDPVSETLKRTEGEAMEDADAEADEDLDAEGEIDAEGDLDVEVVF